MDDPRTIYDVDFVGEGDLLPDFGFSRNCCNLADLLLSQGVDNT